MIVSVPPTSFDKIAPLISSLPAHTVVVDTFNYYPLRDGVIAGFEDGDVESLWSAQVL